MRPCASRCSAPNEPPREGQRTQVPISPYVRNSPMTATRTTPTNSTSEPPMPSSTTSASLARKPRRRRRKRSKPSSLPKPLSPIPTILQPPLYYYSSDFLAYCSMGPGHHSFAWVEALRCWSSPRFYSFPPLLEVPSTSYSPPKPPQLTVPRFAPVR